MRSVLALCVLVFLIPPVCASAIQDKDPVPAPSPWRWMDKERETFHPWHTDAELQQRLYDEALAEMQEIVGVPLPERVEVVIAPAHAFAFVSMETGAKDGSLLNVLCVSRALEWLRLEPAEERGRTIGGDWRGEPGSVTTYVGGMYVLKHARRMIVLNADRTEAQAAHALRHELVHAMQDELFPFSDFFNFEDITIDEKWARQALEEGYASLVTPSVVAAVDGAVDGAGEAQGTTPAEPVDPKDTTIQLAGFFYGAGREAVDAVSERTGSRRELLELVFGHPATTTREVLHPELYARFLETSEAPVLPEPDAVVALATSLVDAHMENDLQPSWATRLGEFGLSNMLVGLGEAPAEAARLASSWRNDSIINFGEERHPVATTSLWVLSDAAAATELEASLKRLAGAHGEAGWQELTLQVGDLQVTGHSLRLGTGRPDVLLVRDGAVVGYAAGQDLSAVIATLRAGP
jgi:hypothetical protein